jgi:surface protein
MKRNIIPLLCLLLLSCSDNNDDSAMNTLPTDSFENSGNLYFESGICVCPNAVVGDQDKIEGTIYTAVDNNTIKAQLDRGNINLCTTLVTNMSGRANPLANFFDNNAFNANIGFWDVSNVTNMDGMFFNATDFNQNISQWDVSKVDNMGSLFKNASSFDQDISKWNTGNVTKMLDLFALASKFNQDISGWNTAQATSMDGMFREAQLFNQDLSGWCVQNISSLPDNFASASGLSESNYPVWGNCPG